MTSTPAAKLHVLVLLGWFLPTASLPELCSDPGACPEPGVVARPLEDSSSLLQVNQHMDARALTSKAASDALIISELRADELSKTSHSRLQYDQLSEKLTWEEFTSTYNYHNGGATEPETKILHIGKTGGSSLEENYGGDIMLPSKAIILGHIASKWFMKVRNNGSLAAPPYKDIAFFVRAPVHRYVSAWLSSYRKCCDPEKDLGCVPWDDLGSSNPLGLEHRHCWDFQGFITPDDLACSLTSREPGVAAKARKAMNNIFHVHRDLKYYLGGLDGIRKSASKVLFVGRTEHLDDDYKQLTSLLMARNSFTEEPPRSLGKEHTSADVHPRLKQLSRCSVLNLQKWYAEDYEILQFLADDGLLEKSYVDDVIAMDSAPLDGQMLTV